VSLAAGSGELDSKACDLSAMPSLCEELCLLKLFHNFLKTSK
jgi:hypothetical protein